MALMAEMKFPSNMAEQGIEPGSRGKEHRMLTTELRPRPNLGQTQQWPNFELPNGVLSMCLFGLNAKAKISGDSPL